MDESSVSLEMERRSHRKSNDHLLEKKPIIHMHTPTHIAICTTLPEKITLEEITHMKTFYKL